MESKYRVLFDGKLLPGNTSNQVKQKLATLYKIPVKQIEPWFSGRRNTIKENIDHITANKYKKAFEQAGAQCIIEKIETKTSPQKLMICPQCGYEQPQTDACSHCGIIIQKYLEKKKQEFLKRKQVNTKQASEENIVSSFNEFPSPTGQSIPPIPKAPEMVSIARDGSMLGTYNIIQVNQLIREGKLNASDLAWYDGITSWIPLALIPGVANSRHIISSLAPLPTADIPTNPSLSSVKSKDYEGLYCSIDDKQVLGLCGGLAHKFNMPSSVVRLIVFIFLWWLYPIALFLPKLPTKNVS